MKSKEVQEKKKNAGNDLVREIIAIQEVNNYINKEEKANNSIFKHIFLVFFLNNTRRTFIKLQHSIEIYCSETLLWLSWSPKQANCLILLKYLMNSPANFSIRQDNKYFAILRSGRIYRHFKGNKRFLDSTYSQAVRLLNRRL